MYKKSTVQSVGFLETLWLEQRFWNQTFEDDPESIKNQNPEQEVQEIRQLLDKVDHQKDTQC